MPLLSPSAKKKQQKIGGVPLDLARAVLGAVFDTLDETRTGSLEVAELQRVGFKTATMVGSPLCSRGTSPTGWSFVPWRSASRAFH